MHLFFEMSRGQPDIGRSIQYFHSGQCVYEPDIIRSIHGFWADFSRAIKGLGLLVRLSRKEQEVFLMRKLVSILYSLARLLNDVTTLLSFNPVRIARRVKNKFVGRTLVSKVWRFPF